MQIKDVDNSDSSISQYDYTYEASVNLTEEKNSSENVPFTMNNAVLTYTEDNRLATYNGQAVLYDADGNMTTGPLAGQMATYAYDARNRLISAGNLSYQYDAENSRISVTDSVYNTQTSYVINNNAPLSQVLVQTDGQNNQTFYVYGLGLIGQEQNGAYTNYHFDLRGSTIALTDEGGNVTDRLQYAPFGELAYRSGNTSTPFLFSGRHGVMTDASDLYYMRARYYNPVAKRFLSPDTLTGQITNPQSQNLYIFCKGNPVIYIDPTGHLPVRLRAWIEFYGGHVDWDAERGIATVSLNGKTRQFDKKKFKVVNGSIMVDDVTLGMIFIHTPDRVLPGIAAIATLGESEVLVAAGSKAVQVATPYVTSAATAIASKASNFIFLRGNIAVRPVASNSKLQNIIKDLYKGQNNPNKIGNGTTMDAIRYELSTGLPVNGHFHSVKGQEYINALNKVLRSNISSEDIAIAQGLLKDLQNALAGK